MAYEISSLRKSGTDDVWCTVYSDGSPGGESGVNRAIFTSAVLQIRGSGTEVKQKDQPVFQVSCQWKC